jgi:glyoxylase-like metal-dependent hydrolase (beta-lactamase superfamily II)
MTVIALNDGTVDVAQRVIADCSSDRVKRLLADSGLPWPQRVSVNAFAVRKAGFTALIDTGAGTALGPQLGRLINNLHAAHIEPQEIGAVLLTHMHPDHSNGLTDDAGRVVFPNAELFLHVDELAHWLDDARMAEATPRRRRDDFAAARRQLAPYRDRIRVFRDGEVLDGVRALPLPGHTPGHTGYQIGSGQDALLVWGDIVHLPDLQVRHPEIAVVLDADCTQAIATRERLFAVCALEQRKVAGMHLEYPGFASIVRDGDRYFLRPLL